MKSRTVEMSRAMATTADARMTLRDAVGDISEVVVCHNLVLVATYIEPEKTAGGILLPDKRKDESRFQGKVGLVLKTGPIAFQDDASNDFGGVNVKPGDWVVYRPADGMETFVNGVSCRFLADRDIKAIVPSPEIVF